MVCCVQENFKVNTESFVNLLKKKGSSPCKTMLSRVSICQTHRWKSWGTGCHQTSCEFVWQASLFPFGLFFFRQDSVGRVLVVRRQREEYIEGQREGDRVRGGGGPCSGWVSRLPRLPACQPLFHNLCWQNRGTRPWPGPVNSHQWHDELELHQHERTSLLHEG